MLVGLSDGRGWHQQQKAAAAGVQTKHLGRNVRARGELVDEAVAPACQQQRANAPQQLGSQRLLWAVWALGAWLYNCVFITAKLPRSSAPRLLRTAHVPHPLPAPATRAPSAERRPQAAGAGWGLGAGGSKGGVIRKTSIRTTSFVPADVLWASYVVGKYIDEV